MDNFCIYQGETTQDEFPSDLLISNLVNEHHSRSHVLAAMVGRLQQLAGPALKTSNFYGLT